MLLTLILLGMLNKVHHSHIVVLINYMELLEHDRHNTGVYYQQSFLC